MNIPALHDPADDGFSNYIYDKASRFGVKVSVRDAHQVTEHVHENIQISIPISDTSVEVTWERSDGSWSCVMAQCGDAIIIPSRRKHSVTWQCGAEFVNLHIELDETFTGASCFLMDGSRAGEIHLSQDRFFHALGENIVSLMTRGIAFDTPFMTVLRLLIVEHITNNYAPDSGQLDGQQQGGLLSSNPETPPSIDHWPAAKAPPVYTSGLAPWQLRKVLAFASRDLKEDRTVAELAELAGLSKGHFSRAFLVSTGLAPHQWIIQERLKLAMSKLTNTDQTIAAIAVGCGFTEQSHFTRSFKRATGISPAAWRRANKV